MLDQVSEIELGFPHDFFASEGVQRLLTGGPSIYTAFPGKGGFFRE